MAVIKTVLGNGTATHGVIDAHGNLVTLKHRGTPTDQVVTIGTASNFVTLTKANVADLLPGLNGFNNTGLVT
jgi:hypothetical protein